MKRSSRSKPASGVDSTSSGAAVVRSHRAPIEFVTVYGDNTSLHPSSISAPAMDYSLGRSPRNRSCLSIRRHMGSVLLRIQGLSVRLRISQLGHGVPKRSWRLRSWSTPGTRWRRWLSVVESLGQKRLCSCQSRCSRWPCRRRSIIGCASESGPRKPTWRVGIPSTNAATTLMTFWRSSRRLGGCLSSWCPSSGRPQRRCFTSENQPRKSWWVDDCSWRSTERHLTDYGRALTAIRTLRLYAGYDLNQRFPPPLTRAVTISPTSGAAHGASCPPAR
jgi:hypothetical protein